MCTFNQIILSKNCTILIRIQKSCWNCNSFFLFFFQSAFESCHKDIRYERAHRARQKDKEGKIDVMHHFQLRSDPETRAEKTAFEPVKKKKKIAPNPNLHPAEVLKNSYFIWKDRICWAFHCYNCCLIDSWFMLLFFLWTFPNQMKLLIVCCYNL